MQISRFDEFDICRIRVFSSENGISVVAYTPYGTIVAGLHEGETVEDRIAECLKVVANHMRRDAPERAKRMTKDPFDE